jgi:hypothetical protein
MALAPILLSLIAFYLTDYLIIDTWIKFLVGVIVFSLVYGIIFWLFSMNTYEKTLALSLVNKIKKKR